MVYKRNLNPGILIAGSGLGVLLLATGPGCAPRYSVSRDYQEVLRDTPQPPVMPRGKRAGRTTVYLLVDGLSLPGFEALRRRGQLPVIESYFLSGPGSRVHTGIAVFPSLTFPNVASILTAAPVDQHPILGNEVYYGDRLISYDSILDRPILNQNVRDQLLFTRLTRQNRNSVSLDRYFYEGATVRMADDIGDGLAYQRSDFGAVDEKTLAAATRLLEESDPGRWPSFVFVHLVGVDGLSHERGPQDPSVSEYTAWLDGRMRPLLRVLERAERKGKAVTAFLSADHGFMAVSRFADAEGALEQLAPGARVANQARYLAVGFAVGTPPEQQDRVLSQLLYAPSVEMTLQSLPGEVRVRTPARIESIRYREARCGLADYALSFSAEGPDYHCPDYYDAHPTPGFYPYFAASVASYFRSPYHPDAVVLAAPGVSFTRRLLGQHGGLTPEEMEVPLLARNAKVSRSGPIRSWQVLRYLDPDPPQDGPRRIASPPPEVASSAAVPGAEPAARTELALSLPDVQHGIEVSTPVSLTQLRFTSPDGSYARTLRTGVSPGFAARWNQSWSERIGSFASYDISFQKFNLPPAEGIVQHSSSASQAALGAEYRFGEKQKLALSFGMGEHYFLPEAPLQAPGASIDKVWIPELRFATWNRLVSLPFADLVFGGSLALLTPPLGGSLPVHTGIAQSSGIYLERPVGTADVAGLGIRYEYEEQNAEQYDRRGLMLLLGAYYGLSFLR